MIPVGSATCQVMIDVSGTPFGGGPTWTDITDYVMTSPQEDGSSEITFSWGRQDWMGDATDSQFALTLRNIDGRFTPGRSVLADGVTANPFYPYITYGTRVRITETIASIVVYMADGYITDVTANPRTGLYWTVQVNCTDILASRMGSTTPLRGWLVEEIIRDGPPSCLYTLQETEGTTSFGDLTGQATPATVVNSKYGAGLAAAGESFTGMAADHAGLLLTPPVYPNGSATSAGSFLQFANPIAAGSAFTVEMWIQSSVLPTGQLAYLFCSDMAMSATVHIDISPTGFVEFGVLTPSGTASAAAGSNVCDGNPHHIVATLAADLKTPALYVDGVAGFASAAGTALTVPPSPSLYVGMNRSSAGTFQYPYEGLVGFLAIYPTALSPLQIAAHYTAGVNGFTGERTDARVVRILSYRANTGYNVDTGLGLVGSGDITDSTEQAALLDAASAEGGLLYVDGQGQITLLNRAHNFNPAATVTLNCANGEVDIPTTFNDDIQHVTNDVTVSRTDGASQRLTNQTSIDQVGVVAREMSANVDSDIHALDLAGWTLAQGVRDQTSIPTLAINLYTLASTAQALAVLQLQPLDVVTVTNIPGVPPSSTMTVQVQGGTYTRSSERFDIELYCTPTPTPVGVWDSGPAWWNSTSVVWAY